MRIFSSMDSRFLKKTTLGGRQTVLQSVNTFYESMQLYNKFDISILRFGDMLKQ